MGAGWSRSYKPIRNNELDSQFSNNSNWMGQHYDLIKDISLRNLCIPGTHNSGANRIDPDSTMYYHWKTCQNQEIIDQLNHGYRYIDIRYGPNSSKKEDIGLYHYPCQTGMFIPVLRDVAEIFLKANKDELVFMKFQQEKDCSKEQNRFIYEQIKEILGEDRIVQQDEKFTHNNGKEGKFHSDEITYGEMQKRGKRFVIYLDKKLFKSAKIDNEFLDREEDMIDGYVRQNWPDGLYKKLEKNIEECQFKRKELYVAQSILTPAGGLCGMIKYVFNADTPSVMWLTGLLCDNHSLGEHVLEWNKNYLTNCIMFDFGDYMPEVCKFIICCNFKKMLKIEQVIFNSSQNELDVKIFQDRVIYPRNIRNREEENKNFTGHGNVLYIPNLQKDDEISRYQNEKNINTVTLSNKDYLQSLLVFGYRYDNGPLQMAIIDVSKQEILIGYDRNLEESNSEYCTRVFVDNNDISEAAKKMAVTVGSFSAEDCYKTIMSDKHNDTTTINLTNKEVRVIVNDGHKIYAAKLQFREDISPYYKTAF